MTELIARHVRALREGDRFSKLEAAQALLVLSFNEDYKVLVAEAGGIPALIDILRDESVLTLVKVNAMCALGNLAHTHDAYKVLIVEACAAFIDLLRDGGAVATQVAQALGNLERDDADMVQFVEARNSLVQLHGAASSVVGRAAWALGQLAFGNDTYAALVAEAGAIPALVDILRGGAKIWDGKIEAACALGDLACRDDNRVRIAAAGAIPLLLDVLGDESAEPQK